jgi:methyl-accepting chemotaxis protein
MSTMIMRLAQSREGVFHAARSVTDKLALGLIVLFAIVGIVLGFQTGSAGLAAAIAVPIVLAPLGAHLASPGGAAARYLVALAASALALELMCLSGGSAAGALAGVPLILVLLGYCSLPPLALAFVIWAGGSIAWGASHGLSAPALAAGFGAQIVAVAVMAFLAFMLRTVLQRTQWTSEFSRNVQSGKFDYRFPEAEIERSPMIAAMHAMQGDLRDTIGVAVGTARELAGASETLAAASQRIASGVAAQTEASALAANQLQDMESAVADIVEGATRAALEASRSREAARDGGSVIEEAAEAMRRMADAVNQASKSVDVLGHKSDGVVQVVQLIRGVAEQTNLLALNAAIEAARAGEAGRGFAVVADEVRKLSEQTNRATGDIGRMLEEMLAVRDDVNARMGQAVNEVQSGLSNADKAGGAIAAILRRAGRVEESIAGIEQLLQTQKRTSGEVTRKVGEIAERAGQANLEASSISGQAQELAVSANSLAKAVARYGN